MFNFFNSVFEFIINIPVYMVNFIGYLLLKLEIFYFGLLGVSVDETTLLVDDLFNAQNYVSIINSSYFSLSADTRYALEYLQIPEAIIMILSAITIRFILRLVGSFAAVF